MSYYVDAPKTWQEVDQFIRANKLDQDEYFSVHENGNAPVWKPTTWRIAIWLTEGGNEGYYLHIDEIPVEYVMGQRKEGKRQSQALGKFWSIESAMRAQLLLWHYIFGRTVHVEINPITIEETTADAN